MPKHSTIPTKGYGTSTPLQLLYLTDFTGGLNLHAGPLQVFQNECIDVLNVDYLQEGGLRQRRAAVSFVHAGAVDPDVGNFVGSMWPYVTVAGSDTLVCQEQHGDLGVINTSGTVSLVDLGSSIVGSEPFHANVFGKSAEGTGDNLLYIQREGAFAAVAYDGATAVELGVTYNEDFATPTSDNMPMARYIATFANHQFVAYVTEGSDIFKDRVRYSHPGAGADFRELDYFDVDSGQNNDYIVGLVPFRDRLLVFKRYSVHAIYGSDTDSFQVVPVVHNAGASRQDAICVTEFGVYFYSAENGLMLYTDDGAQSVCERVWVNSTVTGEPSLRDLNYYSITVGWVNRRVWVAGSGGEVDGHVFVLDPQLRQKRRGASADEGAWTRYTFDNRPLFNFAHWQGADFVNMYLGPAKLEQDGDVDQLLVGDNPTDVDLALENASISSYYLSAWYDDSSPAVKKRWKRPEFIVRTGLSGVLGLSVFHDYDPSTAKRTMSIDTQSAGVVNSAVFGTAIFGVDVFGGDTESGESIVKVSILGTARAIQLKIAGPATSERWTIDGIILKYLPRRVRN